MTLVIGVAGGIASGKSTVARVFERLGAEVIDADRIGHELLQDAAMIHRLVECFGTGILSDQGAVDRRALGRVIFQDETARKSLNRIIRPSIREEIRRHIAERRRSGFDGVIVVDAPLLVETGPTDLADVVILVTAPEAVRKERIMRRNNLSEEETGQRIASQIPDEKQRRWADYVIINENDLDDLENQAMALWSRIVKRKESG